MTELQKEYCEEKGLVYIKPENTEIVDYVSWLEAQIQALRIHNVSGSLPSHIDAGIEAKHYGDEMNKLAEKPNGFHELDFYNGTVWLRQMIEGNEA